MVYKVDGCTSPLVDVKKWLDDQESEAELNLRAKCRCMRVCVYGGEVCMWSEDVSALCECVCMCPSTGRACLFECWATFAPSVSSAVWWGL